MLTLIVAEAALELVPQDLWHHSSVRSHSKRIGKPGRELLLDRSLHHSAMIKHGYDQKRGRPDIIYFTLLEALGSPLNKEGLLNLFVHTNNNLVMRINPKIRIPKNYNRFIGLMEQLFKLGKVPINGESLLLLEKMTLQELLIEEKVDHTLIFSREGKAKTLQEAIENLKSKIKPGVIIGGFSCGFFSENTLQLADSKICVDPEMLEAGVLSSRIIYEYEKSHLIPEKRLRKI